MKDNKIDFEKCNAEFFEENLHKIETTKFDDYNAWLGAMWRLKSLGISNHAISDWCRGSSKFDQKAVDKVLAERTKGKDNFEQSAKWFAKEAQIQLPQVEKKAFDWNEIPEKTLIGRYEFHKVNNDYIPLEINLKQKPEISKIKTVMKKLYGEHKRLPLIVDGDRKCGTNSEWQLGTVEEIIDVAQQMQDENIRTPKGVTFKFNPFNVKKVEETNTCLDEFITDYMFTLIESDEMSLDEQLSMVKWLKLPFATITYSGSKSIHTLVKVDAGTSKNKFKERQQFIYDFCIANGFKIDQACKNAGRESRFPGFYRGDKLQELVADESESEFKTFDEWYEWAKQFVRLTLDAERKVPIMEAMPRDVYEDIFTDGIFYWVKKSVFDKPQKYSGSILLEEIKANILPEVANKILSTKSRCPNIYLSDFIIRQKEFTYKPSLEYDSNNFYNYFKPGFISTMTRDCSINEIPSEFDKLLNNLADEKAKKWLINHMSTWLHLFLNDFKYKGEVVRIETIPIFYGDQGTGKNTIMKYFSQAIEKSGCIEVSKEMFSSQFNSWLLNSVILMNEFSENKESRKASSAAIKLLTSSSATINEKGIRPYKIDNVAYIAFACNSSDYSSFDVENADRRLQFISGGKNLNARKHHICDMELLEKQKTDFINYLLNYEWDFEEANTVYDDEIKLAEKEASKSPMQYLVDKIIEDDNPYILTTRYVLKVADSERINISTRSLGIYLKKRFGERKHKKISGNQHWYYQLREKNEDDNSLEHELMIQDHAFIH